MVFRRMMDDVILIEIPGRALASAAVCCVGYTRSIEFCFFAFAGSNLCGVLFCFVLFCYFFFLFGTWEIVGD